MPELATTRAFKLPTLDYRPATFSFRPAPAVVPDTSAASAMSGSAITMASVADTLAKLPEIISGGVDKGRRDAQKRMVSGIKMGALQGGLTDEQKRLYEGFSFGPDDSVSLKTEDPNLELLKARAYAAKFAPQPTPYEIELARVNGTLPAPRAALAGGIPQSATNRATTGEQPLPQPDGALMGELPQPPVVQAPAPALAGGFSFGAGAVNPDGAPTPEQVAPPAPPALPATTTKPDGQPEIPKAGHRTWVDDDGTIHYEYNGEEYQRMYPGAPKPTVLPRAKQPPPLPGESQQAAEVATWGGLSAKQWDELTEPQKSEVIKRYSEAKKQATAKQGFEYDSQEAANAAIALNSKLGMKPKEVTYRNGKVVVTGYELKDFRRDKLTDSESKTQTYLIRGSKAERDLSGINYKSSDFDAIIQKSAAKDEVFNWALSKVGADDPEAQRFFRAAEEFINAINRRDSGSAIATSEWKSAMDRYFRRAGDKPQVIADKDKARETALWALKVSLPEWAQNPTGEAGPPESQPKTANADKSSLYRQALRDGKDPISGKQLTADELKRISAALQLMSPGTPYSEPPDKGEQLGGD